MEKYKTENNSSEKLTSIKQTRKHKMPYLEVFTELTIVKFIFLTGGDAALTDDITADGGNGVSFMHPMGEIFLHPLAGETYCIHVMMKLEELSTWNGPNLSLKKQK